MHRASASPFVLNIVSKMALRTGVLRPEAMIEIQHT